jgi:hypothetical protein
VRSLGPMRNEQPVTAFPKPVRAPKKPRKPLRRSRMKSSSRGTKHSRRQREWGRMAWLHSLGVCAPKRLFPALVRTACEGPFQVMHLGPRVGYRAPDPQTALGCRRHHEDIDQARDWFLTLVSTERAYAERVMYESATAAWMELTPEVRAEWDARAAQARRA